MDEKIRNILGAAIHAPSGDNCQPWRLVIKDQRIELYNVPERDQSLYNYLQRASHVAHGALLENMALAAAVVGFKLSVQLFPDAGNRDLVARLNLVSCEVRHDPLAQVIYDRCTNRGAFSSEEIADEHVEVLVSCSDGYEGARVAVTTGKLEKDSLSSIVSKNDWLVFENQKLHEFLFDQIRWTNEVAVQSQDGLDVETLGLGKPDKFIFPLLRFWPLVKFMNRFGFAHMIGRKAERLCRNSAQLGAVIVSGCHPEDYVMGGQVMQRVWLQSAALGLQFQPYAGIAFLLQHLREGTGEGLTPKSRAVLSLVNKALQIQFELEDDVLVMFFRIGRGTIPVKKTIRRKLEDVLKVE